MALTEPEKMSRTLHVEAVNVPSLVKGGAVKRAMDHVGHAALTAVSKKHAADVSLLAQVPALIDKRVGREFGRRPWFDSDTDDLLDLEILDERLR
jgi:hypothetical protein